MLLTAHPQYHLAASITFECIEVVRMSDLEIKQKCKNGNEHNSILRNENVSAQ